MIVDIVEKWNISCDVAVTVKWMQVALHSAREEWLVACDSMNIAITLRLLRAILLSQSIAASLLFISFSFQL